MPLGTATAAADGTLQEHRSRSRTGSAAGTSSRSCRAARSRRRCRTSSSAASPARRLVGSCSRQGQPFTIHLKGLGWTQLDNTIAVDYDNSYVGYGCGFNSNGDVVLNLVATGGPGTHLIDMYPLLYTQQPSYANTPYGMVPVLTYARDVPGLALGYQLPAIRLAITIVK